MNPIYLLMFAALVPMTAVAKKSKQHHSGRPHNLHHHDQSAHHHESHRRTKRSTLAVSTLEKQATLSPHNEKLSTEAATSTSGKHEHIKHDHSTSLPHEEKPSSEMKKQGTEESESAETFKQKVPDHHEDQYENMAPGGEAPDVEKPGGGKFQKIKSMLSSKTSNSGDSENDESSGKGMFPMSLIKKGFKKDKKEGEEAKNEAGVESPSTTIAPEEEDEDTSETTIDGDEMETATNATINGTKVNE